MSDLLTNDFMSIEELRRMIDNHERGVMLCGPISLARQLLATMQRETKHVVALKLAKSLTKKYLSRINFDGLDDREITELREIHYQMEEALNEQRCE